MEQQLQLHMKDLQSSLSSIKRIFEQVLDMCPSSYLEEQKNYFLLNSELSFKSALELHQQVDKLSHIESANIIAKGAIA